MPPPDGPEALAGAFVGFARLLRSRGLDVGTGQVVRYQTALAAVDPSSYDDLYWAGHSCLVARHSETPTYDQAFAEYFLGAGAGEEAPPPRSAGADAPGAGAGARGGPLDRGTDEGDDGDARGAAPVGALASAVEGRRTRRLAPATLDELARNRELSRRLRYRLPRRRVRRTRSVSRGDLVDLRRTVRSSLRTDGEILRRAWRGRRLRARPVVVFLDVSGSMAARSRELLWFGRAVCASGAPAEVFCFGTRLVRVTEQLQRRGAQDAVAAAAARVVDWDGGTRIGEALRTCRVRFGRRVLRRGAVVIVCSDGLECGDPTVLGAELARVGRLAHRVVWVNPLKDDPGYQPLTRGMQAALPHLDELVGLETISELAPLCRLLDRVR
jgi:uncharacterized protein with von Willebrand factor type A (vWA) domain